MEKQPEHLSLHPSRTHSHFSIRPRRRGFSQLQPMMCGARSGWLSVKMKSTNFVLMLLMKQNIVVRLMPSCWPAGWKASWTSSERSVPPHSVRPLLGLHSDALGSEGDFHSHVDFDDLDYCFMIIAAVSVTIAKMFSTTMFPPSPCWWSTLSCCPLDNRSPLM